MLLLALIALIATSGCAPEASAPRNLVLISIDTLVPGRMSLYGGPRRTTPNIDALARKSLRFDAAFTTAPWTLPAHTSMFTGLYPSTVYARPGGGWSFHRATLLAQRFQQAGRRTGAVTGGGFVGAMYGAARGFETFEPVLKSNRPERAADTAIAWLESHHEEPFFYFLHTFIVHEPYLDRRYAEPGQGGRLSHLFSNDERTIAQIQLLCCHDRDVTPAEREYMLALYDGGIAFADEMVGRLLEALERLGRMQDTTIIITSDHGQEFWQHTQRGGHGHSLYDDQLRIPLLWYEPGLATAGQAISEPVSLIDLVPTLVSRFGLEADEPFDGVDVSPLLDGGGWDVERALFAEAIHRGPDRVSILTPEAKLIVTPDPGTQLGDSAENPVSVRAPQELYTSDDAAERRNLASSPEHSRLLEDLRERLEAHRAKLPESAASSERSQTDAEILHNLPKFTVGTKLLKKKSEARAPTIDEDARQQLKELGYLE